MYIIRIQRSQLILILILTSLTFHHHDSKQRDEKHKTQIGINAKPKMNNRNWSEKLWETGSKRLLGLTITAEAERDEPALIPSKYQRNSWKTQAKEWKLFVDLEDSYYKYIYTTSSVTNL
jgi:hypothetical protein